MKSQIVVGGSERSLGGLFIGGDITDRGIIAAFGDDRRDCCQITTGKVIIVIRLLVNLRAVRDTWQWTNNTIFLHEAGVGSSAVTFRPTLIVKPGCPQELRMVGN